jgi:hypothetical protein
MSSDPANALQAQFADQESEPASGVGLSMSGGGFLSGTAANPGDTAGDVVGWRRIVGVSGVGDWIRFHDCI